MSMDLEGYNVMMKHLFWKGQVESEIDLAPPSLQEPMNCLVATLRLRQASSVLRFFIGFFIANLRCAIPFDVGYDGY